MRVFAASALLLAGAAAGGSALLAHSSPGGRSEAALPAAPAAIKGVEFGDLFGTAAEGHDPASAEISIVIKPGDVLGELMERSGIALADVERADSLLRTQMPDGVPEGTEITISLGSLSGNSRGFGLQGLRLRTPAQVEFVMQRTPSGSLQFSTAELAAETMAERFEGDAGASLYWSLRKAGVPAEAADEFVRVVPGGNGHGRFSAVVARGRRFNGAQAAPALLYAAVRNPGEPAVRRIKWAVGTRTQWIDPVAPTATASALLAPVSGRITSRFGSRAHPILRFFRFHRGVDIAAPAGTPVIAAAQGKVISAGWNGGHGKQVRVVHSNGLETSYSHMSAIAAGAGRNVGQGEVIGYVGSTGLSTGPHLHYEVRRGGELLDPFSANLAQPRVLSAEQRQALNRHMQHLFAIAQLRQAG